MARTQTAYDAVEDAIVALLTAAGTPFRTVLARGACLADSQVGQLLAEMGDHVQSPAALVFYAGGVSDRGEGHPTEEQAVFTVVVVAAGRDAEAAVRGDSADPGVNQLLNYVRGRLHYNRAITSGTPMQWRGNRRFQLPFEALTVAAYASDFETTILF